MHCTPCHNISSQRSKHADGYAYCLPSCPFDIRGRLSSQGLGARKPSQASPETAPQRWLEQSLRRAIFLTLLNLLAACQVQCSIGSCDSTRGPYFFLKASSSSLHALRSSVHAARKSYLCKPSINLAFTSLFPSFKSRVREAVDRVSVSCALEEHATYPLNNP